MSHANLKVVKDLPLNRPTLLFSKEKHKKVQP